MATGRAAPSTIAPLARLGGMMAIRGVIFMVQQSGPLMDSVAGRLYESEESGDWAQQSQATKALWKQRVTVVLQALGDAAK